MLTSPRKLVYLSTTSLLAVGLALAPVSLPGGWDHPVVKAAWADSSSSCFLAGTPVTMSDGGLKPIEAIAVGDWVMGRDGRSNRVVGIERPRLGGRSVFGFNGARPFVTAEHPFLGAAGWRAIDPRATAVENPELKVARLVVGDVLAVMRPLAADLGQGAAALAAEPVMQRALVAISSIEEIRPAPDTLVYNLLLDGDHTYVADGYVVHNKDGGDGGEGGGGGDSGGDGGDSGGDSSGDGGGDSGGGNDGRDSGDDGRSDGGSSDDGQDNSGPGSDDSGGDGSGSDDSGSGADSSSDDSGGNRSGLSLEDIKQSGDDLTPEQEAELIGNGWQ
jgi:Hom_end-associated Hint